MSKQEHDEETGTATTGHEWDGIKELDTPLPRWWLWTLYATIVWGVLYTIAYPAWPLISSATPGVLGYSSREELDQTISDHEAGLTEINTQLANASFDEIASDADLNQYAQAGGAAVFRTYCSQCHGAGAAGLPGYPNLIDDDWLWGGTRDDIATTVRHGIRWEDDDDSRFSAMPAFGDDGILDREQIAAVTAYVRSLSGNAEPNAEGAEIYADNCAACHGDEGLGDRELGAPNLADAIWLYGGDEASVIATITHSRGGVMPAWTGRLTEAQVKQVAMYVHGLGGGE
ncbi:cytochrome-c oxidase, cbb3-type subunit III [Rhodobacteraceae bacterium NNCM2]|nr:cytochrome-c oxidase, cbb3-type subunit III [Coraliihabitans acroporae]